MPQSKVTGNDFLDALYRGGYSKNPEYNPKTKKGKSVSPYIFNPAAGNLDDGPITRAENRSRGLDYNTRELGYTIEDIETEGETGITVSPYTDFSSINAAHARQQKWYQQLGDFAMRAGVGEVLIGSLQGFANIIDGTVSLVTGNNYERGWYTQPLQDAKDAIDNNFKIYRENPNETFNFSDSGWWFDNMVSVATTASLLLPVAGYARGASFLANNTRIGAAIARGGTWASSKLAKGIAKSANRLSKAGNETKELSTLTRYLTSEQKLQNGINSTAKISTAAFMSRAGENILEARQVYDETYKSSLDNLNNMSNEEYLKFLNDNPELAQFNSKEEQAKEIARQSADETNKMDYAMLLMDMAQFKAIGKLFSGELKTFSKASERIAAENLRRRAAGMTTEQLIKDNIWNRSKEGIKYFLKRPYKSFTAMELGEGFEEWYQGIQQERGQNIGAKYFDPTVQDRTLLAYLKDSELWEQAFWGSIGGIVFNQLSGAGIKIREHLADKKAQKTMTPEAYKQWRDARDYNMLNDSDKFFNDSDELITNIKLIREGKNPYVFKRDKRTGAEIITSNGLINESLDKEEQDLMIDKAITDFITKRTYESVDNGIYDLFRSVIDSNEFDKYLTDAGVDITSSDKVLYKQIAAKMDNVAEAYQSEITNVNQLADGVNPYVARAVARGITNLRLAGDKYTDIIKNIENEITSKNVDNINYSTYADLGLYKMIQNSINRLNADEALYNTMFESGEISKQAKDAKVKELENKRKALINFAANSTIQGGLENIKNMLQEENTSTEDLVKEFNNFVNTTNNQLLAGAVNQPASTEIEDLIQSRNANMLRKAWNDSNIPKTRQAYKDMYNDFSISMDKYSQEKVKDAIETIKNYLRNVENPQEAVEKLLKRETESNKVNEAADILKYGYNFDQVEDARGSQKINAELREVIQEALNQRQINDSVDEEIANSGSIANDNTSTGEQSQNNTSETTTTNNTNQTTVSPTNPVNNIQTGNDIDTTITPETNINTNPDIVTPPSDDTVTNELDDATSPVEIEYSDEEIARQKYIANSLAMRFVGANIAVNNVLKNDLINGDKTAYDKLKQDTINYLKQEGVSENIINEIIDVIIPATIESYANMTNNSALLNALNNLVIGATPEDVANNQKLNSVSGILSGTGKRNAAIAFIETYADTVDGIKFQSLNGQTRYVINLDTLFNTLITDENISQQLAFDAYNAIREFIATNNDSKYLFTGMSQAFLNNSPSKFYNTIKEYKTQMELDIEHLHMYSIEEHERAKDYDMAIEAIANNPDYSDVEFIAQPATTNYKVTEPSGFESHHSRFSHIEFYVNFKDKKGKVHHVKVGVNRNLIFHDDGSISPAVHNRGFANNISYNSGKLELDTDFLFDAILNQTTDGVNLFNILVNYELNILTARQTLKGKDLNKALQNSLDANTANALLKNPLIQQLLDSGTFYFHKDFEPFDKSDESNIERAKDVIESINKILLYNQQFERGNIHNQPINQLSANRDDIRKNYDRWKLKLYKSYNLYKELQDYFEEKIPKAEGPDVKPGDVNLNLVDFNTLVKQVNRIQTVTITSPNLQENAISVQDAMINPDIHQLVIMNKDGKYIDETGKIYDKPYSTYLNDGMATGSMGFAVFDDEANRSSADPIALFNNRIPLQNDNIVKQYIKNAIKIVLQRQLAVNNSTDMAERAKVYDENFAILYDLFNKYGIFNFATKNGSHVQILNNKKDNAAISDSFYINIISKDGTSKQVMSFFRNSDKSNFALTGNRDKIFASANTNEIIEKSLDGFINYITENITINTSLQAFTTKGNNIWHRGKNNEFILTLGGQPLVYRSFGHLIYKTNAFNTKFDGKKGFTKQFSDFTSFYIDASVGSIINIDTNDIIGDNVQTAVENEVKQGRKSISTEALLTKANAPLQIIEALRNLKKQNATFITDRIFFDDAILDSTKPSQFNSDAKLAYDTNSHKIYITPTGVADIDTTDSNKNSNGANAIRLVIHENIHRLLHNNSLYNEANRERILSELEEVYDYTRQKLQEDIDNKTANAEVAQKILDLLNNVIETQADPTVKMEEFLAESLSQNVIAKYLNNTDYEYESNIDGITEEKKTILQKLIDVILKLLGVYDENINKSSILAREYMILSNVRANRQNKKNNTTNTNTNNNQNNKKKINTKRPVKKPTQTNKNAGQNNSTLTAEELETLNRTYDSVIKEIEFYGQHVVKDENFEENHIYYLNGQPVDLSVTTHVHEYEVWDEASKKKYMPASAFGNTFDEAARVYFENNKTWPKKFHIENTNSGDNIADPNSEGTIKKLVEGIAHKLDEIYGTGHYRVITREFAIGGTIVEKDGATRTVAGTMDMVVVTDKGEIDIYDFKTSRAIPTEDKINGYRNQVNAYRQILISNRPSLKVNAKGLFIVRTQWVDGTEKRVYEIKKDNKRQLYVNGTPIQDSIEDYILAYRDNSFFTPFDNNRDYFNQVLPIEDITPSEPNEPTNIPIDYVGGIDYEDESLFDDSDDTNSDDEFSDELDATSDLLEEVVSYENMNDSERHNADYINNVTDNMYGIQAADNMDNFVESFPIELRADIQQLIADGDLEYYCAL